MEILIVEDNEQKALAIEEAIRTLKNEKIKLTRVKGISECIVELCNRVVDIMILDEQLPSCEGGKINEDGGKEIVRNLKINRNTNKPKKIIYLSAYEESLKQGMNEMSHSAILYQHDSEEWKKKLIEHITFFVQAYEYSKRQYLYDIALVATTDSEYNIIRTLSDNWHVLRCPGDSARYEECEWVREGKIYKVVATRLNQMGMPAAATVVTKMIFEFVPRLVVMYGIAGGVENDANFGDIIVATKVWDYCSGKYDTPQVSEEETNKDILLSGAIKAFSPTSNTIDADVQIQNMLGKDYSAVLSDIHRSCFPVKVEVPPKVLWGSLACGSSVIKNRAIVDEMVRKHDRKTLGIDMESYGVFYAVKNAVAPAPKAVCVKAISDFADKDKNNDYQLYAAEISGKFAKTLAMDLIDNL